MHKNPSPKGLVRPQWGHELELQRVEAIKRKGERLREAAGHRGEALGGEELEGCKVQTTWVDGHQAPDIQATGAKLKSNAACHGDPVAVPTKDQFKPGLPASFFFSLSRDELQEWP